MMKNVNYSKSRRKQKVTKDKVNGWTKPKKIKISFNIVYLLLNFNLGYYNGA